MERPTITIEGKKYEMKRLTGRDWRIFSEFSEKAPAYTDADFIEKHAAFIAEFYDVTADDILDKVPLEEIVPASVAIRNHVMQSLTAKFKEVEKNAVEDVKTEQ